MAPRLLHETPDMVRFITALSAFLMATTALAQPLPTTVNVQPLSIRAPSDPLKDSLYLAPDQCAETLSLSWAYTPTYGVVCSDVTFWSTDANVCGDAPVGADVPYPSSTVSYPTGLSARTGPVTVKVSELPGFISTTLSDGGVTVAATCGAADTYKVHRICGVATAGSFGTCNSFGTPAPSIKCAWTSLRPAGMRAPYTAAPGKARSAAPLETTTTWPRRCASIGSKPA